MKLPHTVVSRGASISGATDDVADIPIVYDGTIREVLVVADSPVSGANAVFSVEKNGVVDPDLALTIIPGAESAFQHNLNKPVVRGDKLILNLVSGSVSKPITFTLLIDDGDDSLDAKADKTANINAQTGTTYTLVAADNNKIVTLSNASAITLTVPSGLGAGFNCLIVQLGAGQVSVAAGSDATVHNRQSHTKLAGQYASATLAAHVANTFILQGDTAV